MPISAARANMRRRSASLRGQTGTPFIGVGALTAEILLRLSDYRAVPSPVVRGGEAVLFATSLTVLLMP
jgi:hypothetical protein